MKVGGKITGHSGLTIIQVNNVIIAGSDDNDF